jgi:hypothetical protein
MCVPIPHSQSVRDGREESEIYVSGCEEDDDGLKTLIYIYTLSTGELGFNLIPTSDQRRCQCIRPWLATGSQCRGDA